MSKSGTERSPHPEQTLDSNSNASLKTPFLRLKALENKGISVCPNARNAANRRRTENKSITERTRPKWSRSARDARELPNPPLRPGARRPRVCRVWRDDQHRPVPAVDGGLRLRVVPQQRGQGVHGVAGVAVISHGRLPCNDRSVDTDTDHGGQADD